MKSTVLELVAIASLMLLIAVGLGYGIATWWLGPQRNR
jgi:hypothetical protein